MISWISDWVYSAIIEHLHKIYVLFCHDEDEYRQYTPISAAMISLTLSQLCFNTLMPTQMAAILKTTFQVHVRE